MLSTVFKRLLLLIGGILLCTMTQVFLFTGGNVFGSRSNTVQLSKGATPSAPIATATTVPAPTKPTMHYQRPDFQTGVVYPQWNQYSYGPSDPTWQQGITDIAKQTAARWLEMPVLFSQDSPTSTQVKLGLSTPTLESFIAGIRIARALGFHVFVVPLLGVIGQGTWAASIQFSTYAQEQQWFDSFWQTYQPYVIAAAIAGAEQVSIGTEEIWLQQFAPVSLWNTLIARVHSVFSGIITYDMNWSTLSPPFPAWMSNPNLGVIGVSEYIPLTNVRERIDPTIMFSLWRDKIKVVLDNASIALGKRIVISEIGYRNSADTLYHTWYPESTVSPPDPVEQAAACDAALANVISDPHIIGIFFWGWEDVEGFKLSGQPAVAVLHKWYASPQS
jgi:hypothetical protein